MDYKFFFKPYSVLFSCLRQTGSVLITDLKFIRVVMQLSSFSYCCPYGEYLHCKYCGSRKLAISISGTSFSTELHRLLFFLQPFCSTSPQGILTRRRRFKLSGPTLEVLSNSGFCFLRISLLRQETLQHRKHTKVP